MNRLAVTLAAAAVVASGVGLARVDDRPTCRQAGHGLFVTADRTEPCTPGQWIADPNVNARHVCAHGYNPRPGVNVSGPLKRLTLRLYGLPASAGRTTEADHLYPLWLGGATTRANLWPEPNYRHPSGPDLNPKDRLEFAVYKLVCRARTMTPAAARGVFEGDWTVAYARYVQH
jgi:hypothetical protein